MCAAVQNAAPETHATITATLLVPSGTGPIQVAGGASTIMASSQTSTEGSAKTDAATIIPHMTMTTAAPPASTAANTATSTSASASSASASASNVPDLNTAQIAGISVGIAATLGLAVGLIFLARSVWKRNFGDMESFLSPQKRESKGFGMLKSNQNSPRVLQISAPIHGTPIDMAFRRPGDFQRPMMSKPETIGRVPFPLRSATATTLQDARAQSPTSTDQLSKTYIPYRPGGGQGLPKPALTVSIPQDPSQNRQTARTLLSSRDSVMTEFQEDGEGEDLGGANIWRPPHSDPQSSTTYYVADRYGNWVKSNKERDSELPELPSAMNEAKSARDMDAATGFPAADRVVPDLTANQVSKLTPAQRRAPATRLGPPIEFKDRGQAPRSSSVYSPFSTPRSVVAEPGNPVRPHLLPVAPLAAPQRASAAGTKGHDPSKRQMSKHGNRQNKRRSLDSATTISSSVAEDNNGAGAANDGDPQDGLSPVVESPHTPLSLGQSRAAYAEPLAAAPESTRRRDQHGHKQLPTPPKRVQPSLTLFPRPPKNEAGGPLPPSDLGQPSSTRGVADVGSPLEAQRNRAAAQVSARAPGLNPNPLRNPAAFKTGSPEMRAGSAPPESERQRRPSPLNQHQPYQQRHRCGSSWQLQQQLPHQRSTQPGPPAVPGRDCLASTASQERLGPTGLPDRNFHSPASSTKTAAASSVGSSSVLLTKRLGAESAAALTLRGDLGGRSTQRVKWQRDQESPESRGQGSVAASAAMPGWLPKLTPTRRGGDLFLNVQ